MENWNKEKVIPKKKTGLLQRLLSLAAAAALALSLVGCGTSAVVPGGSADVVPNPSSTAASVDAPFEMHFIDVGQALSVLVECDGQFMLYDGGNVDDGSLVVSYLQKQGVEELQYVFCSHAHEDHVGGLAAALAYFPANHVYSPVTEASTKCFRDFVKYTQYTFALGLGKWITSVTMTVFYVLLYYVWRKRYQIEGKRGLTVAMYVLAAARVVLCMMPQNRWLTGGAPLAWGIYRNIPFALIGLLVIVLFFRSAKAQDDRAFRWMWLTIVLSFGFYIPVVLWADVVPMIGMLMIPKTCAYVWTVLIGYKAMKNDCGSAN